MLLLGASSLPLFASTAVSVGGAQNSWDSLQPDRDAGHRQPQRGGTAPSGTTTTSRR
ncbi:hypothetical protein ACPA9J_32220 [Pseudomonas aeruginosa]